MAQQNLSLINEKIDSLNIKSQHLTVQQKEHDKSYQTQKQKLEQQRRFASQNLDKINQQSDWKDYGRGAIQITSLGVGAVAGFAVDASLCGGSGGLGTVAGTKAGDQVGKNASKKLLGQYKSQRRQKQTASINHLDKKMCETQQFNEQVTQRFNSEIKTVTQNKIAIEKAKLNSQQFFNQTHQNVQRLQAKLIKCQSGLCSKQEIQKQYYAELQKRQQFQNQLQHFKEKQVDNIALFNELNKFKDRKTAQINNTEKFIYQKGQIISELDQKRQQVDKELKRKNINANLSKSCTTTIDNINSSVSQRIDPQTRSNHSRRSRAQTEKLPQNANYFQRDSATQFQDWNNKRNDQIDFQFQHNIIREQLISLNQYSAILYTELNACIRRAILCRDMTVIKLKNFVYEVISLNDEEKQLFENYIKLVWEIQLQEKIQVKSILLMLRQSIIEQKQEIDDSAINVTQWQLILRRLKQLSELKLSSMKKVQLWLKHVTNHNRQLTQLPVSTLLVKLILALPQQMARLNIK